ncbi:hypothetical protein H920_13233 [Fukomys damarensis]|uniref:Uncharacterized protein n=1 Tax=Fukomys damarensis TaxID=885580 RepID=A0A091D372_FUKDA|nr:hypothetical protein H920_13233 [Fukomys damarensis]
MPRKGFQKAKEAGVDETVIRSSLSCLAKAAYRRLNLARSQCPEAVEGALLLSSKVLQPHKQCDDFQDPKAVFSPLATEGGRLCDDEGHSTSGK